MTQRQLIRWGGSEMFTIEVSKELQRRGHQVAIFCPQIGYPAKIVYPTGVEVKSRISELPWIPDIIHGQHHLQAAAALSFFTDTPAIYYCHGWIPWVEEVLLHPRIWRYVMMCEWMVPTVATEFDIPREKVVAVPGFINTTRFSEVRQPKHKLAKALLYGNSPLQRDEISALEKACLTLGISLEKAGYAYGNPRERPESFFLDYDLVFAIGRSASEAIAAGCAVITLVAGQAGRLVTPDNFEEMLSTNFIPIYGTSAGRIGCDWLKKELEKYSPTSTHQVTQEFRRKYNLVDGVTRLEELYTATLNHHHKNRTTTPAEFAPYLEKLSKEVDALWAREGPRESELRVALREVKKLKADLKEKTPALRKRRRKTSNVRPRVWISAVRSLFNYPRQG